MVDGLYLGTALGFRGRLDNTMSIMQNILLIFFIVILRRLPNNDRGELLGYLIQSWAIIMLVVSLITEAVKYV